MPWHKGEPHAQGTIDMISERQRQSWASSRYTPEDVDALFAETQRLLAERRAGKPIRRKAFNLLVASGGIELTNAEAGKIGRMLIELMRPDTEESPYAGILPTERAAMRRRSADRLQGQPLVEPTATEHEPMLGTHEHIVGGLLREHSHYGDNTHEG